MLPDTAPSRLISEYVQGRRILPPSTPFPGPWDNARTPYLVEIMDNMAPSSTVQRTIVMKGAQIGMTAAAENVVAFFMDASPAEILYVSATQDLLEKWATKRLEPLIDSLDIRRKITANLNNPKARRTGDKTFSKQFIGGALDMASAQSAPSLRSDSKRILVRDEIDGSPANLTTGEGNWMEVSKARTNAWGPRAKILDLSTPGIEEASNIAPAYREGDAREYYLPCPHCGHSQHLGLGLEDFPKRFIPTLDEAGHIDEVVLLCEYCLQPITEASKRDMLARGEWRPTKAPELRTTRSYHIPTAISPMMSWRDLYLEYDKVKDSPSAVRSFVNLYLGLPFREAGRRPKIDNTTMLRGEYLRGTVPQGVIYLTAGVDVQRGRDARLEMEIIGHGLGYRTWGIDYLVFHGETEQGPDAGAWAAMNQWAKSGGLVRKSDDGRVQYPVQLIFIDSGDGVTQPTVYQFAASWRNTFAIKGEQSIRSHEKAELEGDKPGKISEIGYMYSQIGRSGQYFYRIGTNYYKRIIYRNLEIGRISPTPSEPKPLQKRGFSDFPADYPDEYFPMLLSEELREDGSYHPAHKGIRTEALDCRVYALAAGDVWLHARTNQARENFKRDHPEVPMTQVIENLTPLTTLEYYATQAGIPLDQ